VLTENGWKKIKDVFMEEKVLTYNNEDETLEYQLPINKFDYPCQGFMYRQKSKFIDLLVTPNHQMLVLRRQRDNSWKLKKVEARDILNKRVKYLKTGKWLNGYSPEKVGIEYGNDVQFSKSVDFKDFCKFMGYYLSEGYVDHTPINGNYTVAICQNETKLYEMAESLKKMTDNKVYFVDNRKACVRDKDLWKYLKQFGYAWEKHVPDIIKQADVDCIKIFLNAYIEGDGGFNGDSPYILTTSIRMRDDIQEMAIKAGYDSDYYVNTLKGREGNLGVSNYDLWRITLSKGIPRIVNKEKKTDSIVSFDGMVYCLEVPNHNLVIRRRGKSVICGNSGYGKTTMHILSRLKKYGYGVICSAYYGVEPGGSLIYEGFPVLSSKEGPFGISSAAKFSKQFNVDVGILFTDFWAFSDFPKVIPNATLYGPMDHVNYCEEILNFTKMYYKIIGLCEWQQKELQKVGIKSDYIYHGVDTKLYAPTIDKIEIKKKYNIPEDAFVIGTVAANSDKEDRKSHGRSMKAVRHFLDSNPDVKEKDIVWIYHTVPNDPRGMPLSSICHKFKLDSIIRFMNPAIADTMIPEEQLAELMSIFDVHLLCSKREGFGMPILETMSCSVPNICHNFSSMTELVQGRGWLCKSLGTDLNLETTPINAETASPDVYSIADCIKDAYFDENKRIGFGMKSREFAKQYDWDILVKDQWVPLLEDIIEDLGPKSLDKRMIL